MTTRVAIWGNSLAVRLPRAVAEEAEVKDGDAVEVTIERGVIVVRPAKKRYTIEELVADIRPEDRGEIDWGPPVGKEVW
ncbi:MAG TPA: AbrB/MazE/SpoVT family DNA-binding domain-containing protein [Vicinamibacterales bacterium]|nr:AbrB/MazE/SpoVT family DNA-binding domain-containing protein [Vicinamibacterales bacterium]